MKLKKKKNLFGKFRSRDLSIARDVFYHCTVWQLKYSDEIKIYNESILIQGKTTHFLNKNSGVLKL